jgi:type IV pilus assembly protein PilC
MAKFKYQARSKTGELQVGFVEGSTKESAANTLTAHELYVLSIESAEKQSLGKALFGFLNRVKIKDLMLFTRQLATLLESEMPLNGALQSLYQQTSNSTLKESVFQILQDVESGLSFSQALEKQRPIFSDFYVSMVRSAEVTGRLEESMLFLASYMEREAKWKGKIANAMIYPAVLLALFVVVAIVMVVVVFPKIQPVWWNIFVKLVVDSANGLGRSFFYCS